MYRICDRTSTCACEQGWVSAGRNLFLPVMVYTTVYTDRNHQVADTSQPDCEQVTGNGRYINTYYYYYL